MRAIQRFGAQLQRLRVSRDLTQDQLAVKAGLSRIYLSKLELGQHDPALSTLVRLAKVLRVSVTELLGETMSHSVWWQVGESRFPTRAEAEEDAQASGEMFVARFQQTKAKGLARRLLPVREKK
ncbi:MAG TPA: helix-turn-helix transcriptional regulator [Nitrospiraceae bacterium]